MCVPPFLLFILFLFLCLGCAVHAQESVSSVVQPSSPITVEVTMPDGSKYRTAVPDGRGTVLIPIIQNQTTAEEAPQSLIVQRVGTSSLQRFIPLLTMLAVVPLALVIAYIIFVYIFVARPYDVPISLVLNPTRIFTIAQEYPRFIATVNGQPSLAQLLVFSLPIYDATPLLGVRKLLEERGIPASIDDIKTALTSLTHADVMVRDGDRYCFAHTLLSSIYRRATNGEQVVELARRVRAENPVYSNALRFFPAASLIVTELDRGELLLRPRQPYDRDRLGNAVYTRTITDRALQASDIRTIRAVAQRIYQRAIEGRVAFVVVDRTPEADARFQIYTFREESGFTVIPLGHSQLRQALLEDRAPEVLNEQIALYLGESDLYAASEPVTDALSFFGRGPLINSIINRFNRGQHVGLFGLRKMGKTSLLKQLPERLRQHVVAEIDLQNLGTEDVGPLCTNIIRTWLRDIRDKYPMTTLPRLAANADHAAEGISVEEFRVDLLSLYAAVGARGTRPRFILMLDEVERMLPTRRSGRPGFRGYEQLLAVLRGVAQQEDFLTLLVASVEPRLNRADRWGDIDNPMYRFFQEVFLPPFEEAECCEMVTNIGQQMGIDYTPDALARIYAETGGHPFIVRNLCSLIIREQPRPLLVTVEMVVASVQAYLLQPDSYFESLWEERLDGHERALLRHLGEVEPLARSVLDDAEVNRRALTQRLGTLAEHHVLRATDKGYRNTFALLRRWVRYQELGVGLEEA